jgi:hypothetical protein
MFEIISAECHRKVAGERCETELNHLWVDLEGWTPSRWRGPAILRVGDLAGSNAMAVPLRSIGVAFCLGLLPATLAGLRKARRLRRRRQNRCVCCGYPRDGLAAPRCPECGRPFSLEEDGATRSERAPGRPGGGLLS